jgi:hypothetical protein
MALKTEFIVIPIVVGKRGKLAAGVREIQKSEAAAIRTAERIGARKAGAVAIAQDIDAEADYFGEPRLIVQVGQVPPGFIEAMAA